MSLEAAIAENTKALNTLISLYQGGAVAAKPAAPVAQSAAKVIEAQSETKPEVTKAEAKEEATATKITYEEIRKPFLDMVNKKGRAVAEALLLELGLEPGQKLSAIAEADYGKALAAIQKASA
jgi:hypothetical protein